MCLYSGGEWGLIYREGLTFGRKIIFFLFSSINHVFSHFSRRTRWAHFTSCYSVSIVDFDQLIAGWGCCLSFLRFVLVGINLGKVSTYGETRSINYTTKMHENAWGRVAFLVNLMFCKLDKFNGPIFGEGAYMRGAYIRDINWLTYLGAYIQGGGVGWGLIYGESINRILWYFF